MLQGPVCATFLSSVTQKKPKRRTRQSNQLRQSDQLRPESSGRKTSVCTQSIKLANPGTDATGSNGTGLRPSHPPPHSGSCAPAAAAVVASPPPASSPSSFSAAALPPLLPPVQCVLCHSESTADGWYTISLASATDASSCGWVRGRVSHRGRQAAGLLPWRWTQ